MTSTMSMQNSGRFGLTNKLIGIIVAGFSVVEAIAAYFFFFLPVYITPVYQMCAEYNADGISCMVSLFGKTMVSKAEAANYQVILSLWDYIANVLIIFLIFTGITLILAFCMYKAMSFAKTYLIAVFGAKHVLGLAAFLVPFAEMNRETVIFGLVDAVLCIALCLFFILINNDEYADDMLFTPEQIKAMMNRMKFGFITYGIFMFCMIFTKYAMDAYGSYWSLYLGWTGNSALGQGYTLLILLAIGLVAAVLYVRDSGWSMYFFAAFGTALAVSDLIALVSRFMGLGKTEGGVNSAWWIATVMLMLSFATAAAVAAIGITKVFRSLFAKPDAANKKSAVLLLISSGSIILSFVFTIVAIASWHKELYAGYPIGAMDYMYFAVYGGVTLFLAMAMLGGYSFTKFATLGMYLMIVSNNFISIFSVFSQRSAKVAAMAAEGTRYMGYNYITAAVMFILSIVACAVIVLPFVIKEINDYMYEKRFS